MEMKFYTQDGKEIPLADVLASEGVKSHVAAESKKHMDAELVKVLGDGDGEPIARVARLTSNNQTLTTEKKKWEDRAKDLESKAGKGNDDVEKVKQAMQADLDTSRGETDTARKQLADYRFSSQLQNLLITAKVKPSLLDAAQALIRGKKVEQAGDLFTVEGKTLDTYVKEFVNSDMGREFVQAPDHAGGGSGGSGKASGATGVNPWKKETRNLTQQAELNKTDPAQAARLKAEAGVVDAA